MTVDRSKLRAIAGFVPDCIVFFQRLLRDPAVPRRRKAMLGLAVVYLAIPFDLVPDFIPVIGLLDDALVVMLVLRMLLRSEDRTALRAHWPGPDSSFDVVSRLA